MNAVVTDLGATAKLKLFSAADVLLATFTLGASAGTVSGSVLTLADANGAAAGIANTTAVAAGTATKASMTTMLDAVVITNALTVGVAGSGADIILDNNVLTVNQAVQLNSGTITHA